MTFGATKLCCAFFALFFFAVRDTCSAFHHISRPTRHSNVVLHQTVKNEEELRAELKANREKSDTLYSTSSIVDTSDEVKVLDDSFLRALKKKRPYISIVAERLVQAIDDNQISQRMKQQNEATLLNSPTFYTVKTFSRLRSESKREKLLVLGTGWGGHAFLKTIDATKYDVTVISPRNYFMFTPMLSASAVGTVEFRSICEPIRNVNPFVEFLEASAVEVDTKSQKVVCRSIKCEGTACDIADFDVEYDHLVIAVGATSNTFGIKGVREHCQFLKQVEDAAKIRRSIAYCFERANIPGLSEAEIKSALSFVIVGAGPTGVEFCGELRDWLEHEGRRYYGRLLKYVRITVLEAGPAVLPVFDQSLQKEAFKRLTERETALVRDGYIEKEMTTVLLRAGVKEIDDKKILLSTGETLDYGFAVWAAGNGPIPFVLDFIEQVPEQKSAQNKARGRIVTDSWLRVVGAENVYSIGDCAVMDESPLPATAQVASQQGAYLGRIFSKGFSMKTPKVTVPAGSPGDSAPDSDSPATPTVIQLPPYKIRSAEEGDSSAEPTFVSDQIGLGRLGVPAELKVCYIYPSFFWLF